MKLERTKTYLALLAIAAFLVFPSYSTTSFAAQKQGKQKKPPLSKPGQVIELGRIDQLKEAFQRDARKLRFLTILSPT